MGGQRLTLWCGHIVGVGPLHQLGGFLPSESQYSLWAWWALSLPASAISYLRQRVLMSKLPEPDGVPALQLESDMLS